MRDQNSGIPLKTQCDFLGVSTSGYYAWRARPVSLDERRKRRQAIDEAVKMAFYQHKQRYGSPRLSVELNESGFAVSENTVAKSLQRQLLVAKAGKKFKATTNSWHSLPVSPNLLNQDFTCSAPDQKWCGDITYRTPGIRGEQDARIGSRVCRECRQLNQEEHKR